MLMNIEICDALNAYLEAKKSPARVRLDGDFLILRMKTEGFRNFDAAHSEFRRARSYIKEHARRVFSADLMTHRYMYLHKDGYWRPTQSYNYGIDEMEWHTADRKEYHEKPLYYGGGMTYPANIEFCPFCNSDIIAIENFDGNYFATCSNCKADGPRADSVVEAFLKWNLR